MEDPLYNLVLGNVGGVRKVDDPNKELNGQRLTRCEEEKEEVSFRGTAEESETAGDLARPFLEDKERRERSKDENEKRKKRQQVFEHAKRSAGDIPDRIFDRRAIWENREQERKSERFPEDEDENDRDKVQEYKEKEKQEEFETIKERYLRIFKKRAPQPQQVFFDWNASENTALDCNSIYKDSNTSQFDGGGTSRSLTSRPKRRSSPSSTASCFSAGGRRTEKEQDVLRLKKGGSVAEFEEDDELNGRVGNGLRKGNFNG
ncbi:hypothetical protein HPB47_005567 [Ixodes persulcatus]|uniref:Uncharacterized protein n=1 Tax=Ixodes persulcatus TaxID=34615 RepID=A0AC60PCM1_IXOPE|nr:hypothetical protein HPB47_005567 [Ixodes persulcatus]